MIERLYKHKQNGEIYIHRHFPCSKCEKSYPKDIKDGRYMRFVIYKNHLGDYPREIILYVPKTDKHYLNINFDPDIIFETFEPFYVDIDEHRVYKKWLIIDCHCASGSVCFIKDKSIKTGREYLDKDDRRFTYNIDWALTFDSKEEAETYIEEHKDCLLCPSVIDYRIAIGVARELRDSHILYYGSHIGEYVC